MKKKVNLFVNFVSQIDFTEFEHHRTIKCPKPQNGKDIETLASYLETIDGVGKNVIIRNFIAMSDVPQEKQ
ncbi:hypothetical protein [Ilyobacter sp.]|uniref:hypothetical protein n=1 Tax=Ilyobacter sp. TaxID=3100343 RepID=UPI003567B0D5